MNETDETLEQPTPTNAILQAIAELSKKIDGLYKEFNSFRDDANSQFEAIRQGIVQNSVSYDRLKAEVLLLRADVKELSEEVRHKRNVLV